MYTLPAFKLIQFIPLLSPNSIRYLKLSQKIGSFQMYVYLHEHHSVCTLVSLLTHSEGQITQFAAKFSRPSIARKREIDGYLGSL